MSTYKLSYFGGRGTAEVIRLTFAAAAVDFEDERLKGEEWAMRKPDAPMKAMPLLTVTEGDKETVYCQSFSIARFIAKKHGLMGSTPEDEFLIDEIMEGCKDTITALMKAMFEKDETKKAEFMEAFKKDALIKYAEYVTSRQKQFGSNGYIVGDKLTLADVTVYGFVEMTCMQGFKEAWKEHSDIMSHYEKIKLEPRIAAWIAKRPESTF